MVIIELRDNNQSALCRWIDKYGRVKSLVFLTKELERRED